MPMKITEGGKWFLGTVLFIIFLWTCIAWGAIYLWKDFIKPKAASIVKIIEIERSSYVDRHLLSK